MRDGSLLVDRVVCIVRSATRTRTRPKTKQLLLPSIKIDLIVAAAPIIGRAVAIRSAYARAPRRRARAVVRAEATKFSKISYISKVGFGWSSYNWYRCGRTSASSSKYMYSSTGTVIMELKI